MFNDTLLIILLAILIGAIVIVSSVATTIAAAFFNYSLEQRRERQRLKVDLSKRLGWATVFVDGESKEYKRMMELYNELIVDKDATPEDIAYKLGVTQALEDTVREIKDQRSQNR